MIETACGMTVKSVLLCATPALTSNPTSACWTQFSYQKRTSVAGIAAPGEPPVKNPGVPMLSVGGAGTVVAAVTSSI